MSARKVLCGVFDSVTATSDGIDRLDPSEDWRPYVVAAIPGHWVPTKQKTGLGPASSTQRVEAMSNFAFAPVGPRDHGDEVSSTVENSPPAQRSNFHPSSTFADRRPLARSLPLSR